jgi:ribA/ribD-fused uncharacterized protein
MRPLPDKYYFETLENDWGVFFWRPTGFLNNWTYVDMEIDGVIYCNPEQAIMHRKALLFNDVKMAKKIMETRDSRKQKALGRKVSNFSESVWRKEIPDILFNILLAKFTQNPLFGEALLQTGKKRLFESSPNDLIWGTGVSPQDSVKIQTENEALRLWKGKNLLGKTLERVRSLL